MSAVSGSEGDSWRKDEEHLAKHFHAIGAMSLSFNVYEWAFGQLLGYYLGLETTDYFLARLSNQDKVDALLHFGARRHAGAPYVVDHLDALATHFKVCCQNRNIVLHAHQFLPSTEGIIALRKIARREPGAYSHFNLKLGQLRRVADEMRAGAQAVVDFYLCVAGLFGEDPPASALPSKPRSVRELTGSHRPPSQGDRSQR